MAGRCLCDAELGFLKEKENKMIRPAVPPFVCPPSGAVLIEVSPGRELKLGERNRVLEGNIIKGPGGRIDGLTPGETYTFVYEGDADQLLVRAM